MLDQPLLDILVRFEKQISAADVTHEKLVELFCLQIIRLLRDQTVIEPLKRKWRQRYENLCGQKAALEKATLQEITSAFHQLQEELKRNKGVRQTILQKKIGRIEGIVAGAPSLAGFTSWPLYYELFSEVKELLELILTERNGEKICRKYAVLGVKETHTVGTDYSIKVKKKSYIMHYTFAPSLDQTRLASEAVHWDRTNDSAVVWNYFLCAEWCWNTKESYFVKTFDVLNKPINPFPSLAEKATWLEVATVRDRLSTNHKPIIFTSRLFREGFQTLVNDIMAFLARNGQINESVDPIEQVTLELHLNENKLWILAHFGLGETKRFYIKRFNDGKVGGSTPFAFLETLLKNYADGGEVALDFADKSENVPKALERMGMLSFFKHLFFGQSRGNKVVFHGSKISLPRDGDCHRLLEDFERHHQKAESPKYEYTDWRAVGSSKSDSENS